MKKAGFPFFIITLSIFLSFVCIAALAKEVQVQVHVVQGSGITQGQVTGYVGEANRIDGPAGVTYSITSRHNYGPNTPYDSNKNDPCRINIWAVPKKPWGTPTVSGQDKNVIWLVPGDANVSLRDSTLAHELDHALGLKHPGNGPKEDPCVPYDPNNKMAADNWEDPNGKITSGHRTGTNLTGYQKKKIRDSNTVYALSGSDHGICAESYDIFGDVLNPAIDLGWTQGWIEYVHADFVIHLQSATNNNVTSFFDLPGADGSFLINSDGNPLTGEPPEGLDCIITYSPFFHELTLQKYDSMMGWHYAPLEGITAEVTYSNQDSNLPPIPSGIAVSSPLTMLLPPGVPPPLFNRTFLFKAVARTNTPPEMDSVPDVNMLKLTFPVVPIPGDLNLDNKVDTEDLDIMSAQWQKTGASRSDIFPPPGDGVVDFIDYATLANNWMVGYWVFP